MQPTRLAPDERPVPPTAPAVSGPGSEPPGQTPLEPMDPQVTSIQPGGGVIATVEQAWGHFRRWYLKRFRPRYVARMRQLRQGDVNPCPHEVLDPRDLKFYRNRPGYFWLEKDDPFAWRDRLPFVRVGLAELILLEMLLLTGLAGIGWGLAAYDLGGPGRLGGWLLTAGLAVCMLLVAWFFRNPGRIVPQGPNLVVAPADGKVVSIEDIEDEFLGGPAVRIGIFLSIFNVHMNRVPMACRVLGIRYRRGKCLNALRPESARENERLIVRLETIGEVRRRLIVTQITGAIARRIVCWLKPGDVLNAGDPFGMIKLGSRTELTLPRNPTLRIRTRIGERVQAGTTILANFESSESDAADRKGPDGDS